MLQEGEYWRTHSERPRLVYNQTLWFTAAHPELEIIHEVKDGGIGTSLPGRRQKAPIALKARRLMNNWVGFERLFIQILPGLNSSLEGGI